MSFACVRAKRRLLFQIGDDYLLGVWRDEQDVEQVRLYAIEKPGGA